MPGARTLSRMRFSGARQRLYGLETGRTRSGRPDRSPLCLSVRSGQIPGPCSFCSFSFSFSFFLEPISSCPKSAHIPHPPAEHRSLTRSTRGVFARPPQPSRQKAPSGCGSKLKKGQKPVAGRGFLPKQHSPRAQNVANGKRRWQKTVSGYGWVRNRRRSTPSACLPIFSAKAPAIGGGEQDSYRTASERLRGGDLPTWRETYNRPMR